VQHGRVARPEQRAQRQRHGQRLRGGHLAVEAFIAPTDFEPVETGKARGEGAERGEALAAGRAWGRRGVTRRGGRSAIA